MPKRYYWLKLKDDFFNQKEIKKLRKIAGGDTFTIIYLKMLLLSLNNNGVLEFEGIEETFADELSLALDEGIEDVQLTLTYLHKHNLIEECAENDYFLTKSVEMTGSESDSAERMRKHRQAKASPSDNLALQSDSDVTKRYTEKRREREDTDKRKNIKSLGDFQSPTEGKKTSKKDINAFFEAIWALYPKKQGKGSISDAKKKILYDIGAEEMSRCIKRYEQYIKGNDIEPR